MNLEQAMAAVGARNANDPFPTNSKMPGPSYDLPASACKRGTELASRPDAMCNPKNCYAKRGFFVMPNVQEAHNLHLASIDNEDWVDGFVYILETRYSDERWFRFHASGDIQHHRHLLNIMQVAVRRPQMRFWLPTHEPYIVHDVLANYVRPENLTIRISADAIGARPDYDLPWYANELPRSMVHHDYGDPPSGVYECRAHDRDNECGRCRACWSPNADVVSYTKTSAGGRINGTGRRSPQLRLFQENA